MNLALLTVGAIALFITPDDCQVATITNIYPNDPTDDPDAAPCVDLDVDGEVMIGVPPSYPDSSDQCYACPNAQIYLNPQGRQPFEDGLNYLDDDPENHNPYEPGTPAAESWLAGVADLPDPHADNGEEDDSDADDDSDDDDSDEEGQSGDEQDSDREKLEPSEPSRPAFKTENPNPYWKEDD